MPVYDLGYTPVSGGSFAWRDVAGGATPNPAPPNASWAALTAPTATWSGTSAYAQYTLVNRTVSGQARVYMALNAITAPSATTELARYNDSATSGKRVSGGAAYHSIPELCVNHTAAMGDFPSDTSGMFRLRYVPGGSATQAAASMTGNLTVLFEGNTANPYRCIRVGSIADFTATFGVGSSNATDNSPARFFGGTWHLDRVTTGTPQPNTAPESDSTNWIQVQAWSGTAAYAINAAVSNGTPTAYFRAIATIAAPIGVTENDYRLVQGTAQGSPTRNPSNDISLLAGAYSGGAATSTRVYFVFIVGQLNFAQAWDHSGTRQSGDDINLGSGNWHGGTATSTRLYFINDASNTAVAYDHNRNRQASDDISLGTGLWNGAAVTSTRLYFVDDQTNFARAWDYSGNRQSGDDIDLGTGNWSGGAETSNRLYFVDDTTNYARAYDHSGNRQASDDINLSGGQWTGAVAASNRLYFIELVPHMARAYDLTSITSISWKRKNTLASGDRSLAYSTEVPVVPVRNSSADFSIQSTAGHSLEDGTETSTRFYFLSSDGTARAYDHNGNRQSVDDIVGTGSNNWVACLSTNTRIYLVAGSAGVENHARAYDHSGNRQSADDFSLGTVQLTGGFATSNRLYFIRAVYSGFTPTWTVISYDHSGNRQSADDISLGTGGVWAGGFVTSNRLYLVQTSPHPQFVRVYDHNWNRQVSEDIALGTPTKFWNGGVVTGSRFFIIDGSDDFARAWDLPSTTTDLIWRTV